MTVSFDRICLLGSVEQFLRPQGLLSVLLISKKKCDPIFHAFLSKNHAKQIKE